MLIHKIIRKIKLFFYISPLEAELAQIPHVSILSHPSMIEYSLIAHL
jgi:hypothetical protein